MKNFKRIINLIIIILFFMVVPVKASNDVEYTLTITKDYKFQEVIKYTLTDYTQKSGGNNPYSELVTDKKHPVDITQTSFYEKTKKLENNIYYVTLSHTYSEYALSNSILLKTCFNNSDYEYTISEISFSGSDGFRCLRANNLVIKVITDFPIISTNATKEGNVYTWYPKNYDFKMNISFTKEYEERKAQEVTDEVIYPENNKSNNTSTITPSEQETEKDKINPLYIYIPIGILFIVSIIVILVLSKRNKDLNKI